jgi:hypothetical protein
MTSSDMGLNDFIKTTLTQIIEGVEQAQKGFYQSKPA